MNELIYTLLFFISLVTPYTEARNLLPPEVKFESAKNVCDRVGVYISPFEAASSCPISGYTTIDGTIVINASLGSVPRQGVIIHELVHWVQMKLGILIARPTFLECMETETPAYHAQQLWYKLNNVAPGFTIATPADSCMLTARME